jgi:glycosyltransferase involved in cell wall biosynthesis
MIVSLYFFKLENSAGGAERSVVWLSNKLVSNGHIVHLISLDRPTSKIFYTINKRVLWHKIGFRNDSFGKLAKLIKLTSLLKSIKSDVFIGFVMGGDKVVYASCLLSKTKLIAAERNSPIMYSIKLSKISKFLHLNLFFLAKKIVTQFSAYKSGYPFYLRKKIVAIPNPVKPAREIAKVNLKNGKQYTLLCVSRFDKQKNLESLIMAFSMLAKECNNWNLKIIGNGILKPDIQNLINNLDLNKRIKIIDSKTDVESEYAKAHLFCLPSIWEGFPNSLAEALSAGLPSIGFLSCDGVNKLIKHGKNGILIKKNNHENLAIGIKSLMKNSSLRLKMSKKAILISSEYREDEIYKSWEKVLYDTIYAKK